MGKPLNLKGQIFNRLTVLEKSDKRTSSGSVYWKCKCSCGNITYVVGSYLKSNHTRSCGCIGVKTHGLSRSRIYGIFHQMKKRCYNPKSPDYINYGGKGVTICSEWLDDFIEFNDWSMKNGYNKSLTIDRKNPKKGYSPDNCRWVNLTIQSRNRDKIKNSSSKYIGVSYWKKSKKFISAISRNGKRVFIKSFNNEIDAAKARDKFIISNKWTDEYQLNFNHEKM